MADCMCAGIVGLASELCAAAGECVIASANATTNNRNLYGTDGTIAANHFGMCSCTRSGFTGAACDRCALPFVPMLSEEIVAKYNITTGDGGMTDGSNSTMASDESSPSGYMICVDPAGQFPQLPVDNNKNGPKLDL